LVVAALKQPPLHEHASYGRSSASYADLFREQARVNTILDHTGDEGLRTAFLSLPQVRAMLAE